MKLTLHALLIAALLVVIPLGPSRADPYPSDPPVETQRSSALRAVYFPFLAVGHGLLLVAKYGIGYPIYFVVKPVYDFLYESSDDPNPMRRDGSDA